jgi:hypothetical protein
MKGEKKKYHCIAKVGPEKFVKYNVNNLVKFTSYLDRDFPDWRWYNVYDKETRNQVANFTKNNRPTSARVG